MGSDREHLRNLAPEVLRDFVSDQRKGVIPPPLEKPAPPGATLIPLVAVDSASPGQMPLGTMPLVEAIRQRESRRKFATAPLALEELSFLLWATQGVRGVHPQRVWAKRTVPSGGCRHPMETYLHVRRVESMAPGLYRYLPLEHAVIAVDAPGAAPRSRLGEICYKQSFVDEAAVTFVWTAIPYRTEWRYGPDLLKDILLTCGHICQNLYLACEAIGAGTCAILTYDQDALDAFLGVDGQDEISVYVAPVGRV